MNRPAGRPVTLARGLNSTFSSLRVRNYRIFILTQVVSTNGTWMQRVAQFWLVLHLTGSGVALGLTSALQFVPVLLLSTWGGLIADRGDKRRILLATQIASSVLSFALAAITLTEVVQLWMVYVLAFGLGIVNVVDSPTRLSFVTEMVGAPQLPNAIGLNSAVFTSARMLGPAIAGVVISLVGTGWCFLYNGFSFFPVVAGLLLMRTSELHRAPAGRPDSRPDRAGPPICLVACRDSSAAIAHAGDWHAGLQFQRRPASAGEVHIPVGCKHVRRTNVNIGRWRLHRSAGLSLSVQAHTTPSSLCLPGVWRTATGCGSRTVVADRNDRVDLVGFAMVTSQATANALIQINSDAALRGRVMALFVTAWVGTTPIGAPIVGWISQEFGPRSGLAVGGAATIIAALVAIRVLPKRRAVEQGRGQTRTADPGVSKKPTRDSIGR